VEALAARLGGRHFDLVVSSDLQRAADTAAALGHPVETDPEWREMSLGAWEGLTLEEVQASHPEVLEALRAGEDVRPGGSGETFAEFQQRVWTALARLLERVGDGSAAVVTHGGVIDAIVGRLVGRPAGRRAVALASNTSISVVAGYPDQPVLTRFNDAAHLHRRPEWVEDQLAEGRQVVTLVRHGVTTANREGRWQGRHCWGLHPHGERQAEALARWYRPQATVVSSPLARARRTAELLAADSPVRLDADLAEMSMGSWEGLTTPEIEQGWPELWKRIYHHDEDLPRGETGETLREVGERMLTALGRLPREPEVVVVTHGAAIKALVGQVTGVGADIRRGLATAANASVTHLVLTPDGPVLADYSVAPHLEQPEEQAPPSDDPTGV
jgi:probable phosphoglycerate mutase